MPFMSVLELLTGMIAMGLEAKKQFSMKCAGSEPNMILCLLPTA
jgi:hypothetical protein